MTRNLKVLVLGLVAALALTAIAASSASAFTQFNSEEGTTAFKGTQKAASQFTTNPGTIKCTSGTVRGMISSTVQTEVATSDSTAKTGSEVGKKGIEYGGCTFLEFINVKVENNNCQYNVHASGVIDIKSGGGECATKGIVFSGGGCVVHVKPQNNLTGATLVNGGSGTGRTVTIDIPEAGVTGITYTAEGCITGGNGTFSNGVYKNSGTSDGASFTVGGTTNTEENMTAKGVFMS